MRINATLSDCIEFATSTEESIQQVHDLSWSNEEEISQECAEQFLGFSSQGFARLHEKIRKPPQWMLEQIERDFSAFELGGISRKMLDDTFSKYSGGRLVSRL